MESNGKHITLDGVNVDYQTSPIYWGEPGTNGQHSFFQLLHQGTKFSTVRFYRFLPNFESRRKPACDAHGKFPCANRSTCFGKTEEEVKTDGTSAWLAPHRVFEGNRPTNTIFAEKLTPEVLGALIALYEHSVYTQGVIWNIDSFDQWGVELGKVLAKRMIPELENTDEPVLKHDSSTNTLIRRYRKFNSY